MSNNHHKKCLLLNGDFSPISIIEWQRAILWSMKYTYNIQYGIQILEYYDDYIYTAGGDHLPLPAVARTTKYYKLYHHKFGIKFSRQNVFARDNYSCQYCGQLLARNQLTYDHVIPKSRFSDPKMASTWNNIVTACYKCNFKKADQTPQEAGMKLLAQPIIPKFSIKYLPWKPETSIIESEDSHRIWKKYIKHIK